MRYMEPIKKLFEIAATINEQTDKAVFVSYFGHVNCIDVHVAEGKEKPAYNNRIFSAYIRLADDREPEKVMNDFEDAFARLNTLREEVGTYAI